MEVLNAKRDGEGDRLVEESRIFVSEGNDKVMRID
jgi:hypothetical protein